MNTLEEAWKWYEHVRQALRVVERLGTSYWEELPWNGPLGRDEAFRHLEADQVLEAASNGLAYLDDQAIVVLFSVFEAIVRTRVLDEMTREKAGLRHPALKLAAEETALRIAEGSFFRVLEPYKAADANLVELVNQVRRYRNWVAHGKKGDVRDNVDPRTAYDRLQRFLALFGMASGSAAPP